MKTDDRDDRLGATLDKAVAGLRPLAPDVSRLKRRGSSRRAVVLAVSVATVSVFVGAIGFAATQLGRDADQRLGTTPQGEEPTQAGWVTETAGSGAFTVEARFPRDWKLRSFDGFVLDSNSQPVLQLRTPDAPLRPACGGLAIEPQTKGGTEAIGPSEAVLWVNAYTGGGWREPRKLPSFDPRPTRMGWSDATIRLYNCSEGGATTATFGVLDGGRWIFQVTMGSDVMNGRVGDRLLEVMNGIVLPPDPAAPIRFVPDESWVSDSTNEPGGSSAWTANADMTAGEATFPDPAVLSEDGILVTVFQVGDEPPAPDNPNFSPASLPLDLPEEIETSWEGYTDGRSRSTLLVAVNGRALQIHVYYGTIEPGEEMLVDAEAALERLIVDPVPAPPSLPPPVRAEYRSERVGGGRYQWWPISGPAQRGIVYRFGAGHCGLDGLVDFDGSFWEETAIVDGAGWVPAGDIPDGDVGTIELTGADWARYEASDGTWTLLSRVDGPIVRQLCD